MTTIDLDAKARDIRRKLGQLHALARRSASLAVEVGRDLAEVKQTAKKRGGWMKWLAKHRISHDTAENLISLYTWSQSNPDGFRKFRNRLPVSLLYRVSRYGIDEVEKLLHRLDSGELKTSTKAATTLHQRISGLSRRKKTEKPKPEEPKSEQEPEPEPTPSPPEPEPTAPSSAQPEPPPAETNGHAAAAEPQALSSDDAAAAFFAALADHPPPDNARALFAAFHEQTRLRTEDINTIVHILVQLQWLLKNEVTPPERGQPRKRSTPEQTNSGAKEGQHANDNGIGK
jgi:hypothetical protein